MSRRSVSASAWSGGRWPAPRWLPHLYTLAVVMVGCVLFRAASLDHARRYLAAMFGANEFERVLHPLVHFVDAKLLTLVALALIGCAPFLGTVANRIIEFTPNGFIDRMLTFDDYLESSEVAKMREQHYQGEADLKL